jgi:hypothetical protein
VIAVEAADGHARQTVAYYVLEGDTVKISTESKRLKGRAVERTGWASICVIGDRKPFPYATLFGPARIRRENIGEDTARLVEVFSGHKAEVQSDEALAGVDRVILEIEVERVLSGYIED